MIKYNLLIIDDDIAITESLKFAFKRKYNLFIANSFTKGLELFISNDIDLVLLDLKLEKKNGLELFNMIKEIDEDAIVIIITAYGTIESSKKAIKSGVFDYLTKPIDLKNLEEIVEKGLEKRNQFIDLEEKKEIGDFEKYGLVTKSDSMREIIRMIKK